MNSNASQSKITGSLAVAIAAMLWAVDGVILTPQLQNLNVTFVVFIVHMVPFVLMNIFLFKQYRYLSTMSKSDYFYFFLVALFGGVLGTLSIVKALFLLDFNNLSVIVLLQKLQPIFAILLARIILKEKIQTNFALWASIAIIAGYFLTFGWALPDTSGEGSKMIYAALLSLLAAFSFGSSTVFSKKALSNFSFVTSTFYRYFFASVIALIITLVSGHLFDFSVATPRNWLFIAIIGLTTGSGAIFLYYYGLRNVKAMLSTIIELLYPITAVILDSFLNHTHYSLIQWLAALVMIFAILQLNIKKQKD